ncbi:hypothetical protein [Clostridium hydrogenum]|uniref:hypothetical protein n=1 Tax=Clostridium hydrogenum TaxID=2855764 RepID=UPI001F461FBF|nr:hypothetical protein [Clostridium hydrogenum]
MKNEFLLSSIFTSINLVILLINYFFNKKNTYTNYYSKILDTRLNLIYSPLCIKLSTIPNYYLIDDKDFIDNFHKYSYLLEDNLYDLIIDIINIESSIKRFSVPQTDEESIKTHKSRLEKLTAIIKSEYKRNTSIYKNTYIEIEKETSYSPLLRLLYELFNFCYYLFIFTIIVLLVLYYSSESMKGVKLNSSYASFEAPFFFIFSLGFCFSVFKFVFFVSNRFDTSSKSRIRKKYKSYHIVPEDGFYICSCCNEKRYFYKYERFTPCPNNKSWIKKSFYKKID